MIRVEEAEKIVREQAGTCPTEYVKLELANGRVLRETIFADRDFPPFDRVAMDGIAIQFAEFDGGRRQFVIASQNPAGQAPGRLTDPRHCIEVATGSALPEGADTVIPYEQIQTNENQAVVTTERVLALQNIHQQGLDQKQQDVLLEPGRVIGPAELAILATVGKTEVQVAKLLKVAIVATGDELVPISATPLPWQIRLSNPYALTALLQKRPVNSDFFHCVDDFKKVKNLVEKILDEYDVLLLSGGVSAGKRDFIPELLEKIGVEIWFHKVAQRPGKPLLFGQRSNGSAIFALPGNPVSAFMCTCRYVLPWLEKSLGMAEQAQEWAFLTEPLEFKPDLTWFVPVKIENRNGQIYAHPKPGHGSGDLANLQAADGFLELPRGRDHYGTDEPFRLIRYRI